jgi:mRNA-degrading endonuclease RelE of RelBE toxin-antitoxin system
VHATADPQRTRPTRKRHTNLPTADYRHAVQRTVGREHGIRTAVTPSTLLAYALFAYSVPMVFVELTPFVAFRNEYWTDEDLRALQSFLLVSPEAGDLIRGGSGLRKLRWSAQGRGKRGGARVIYYWHKPKHHVYLIFGHVKSERDALSYADQGTVLLDRKNHVLRTGRVKSTGAPKPRGRGAGRAARKQ